jgi:hypothetical protein
MKPITFPPLKISKTQILLPSGVVTSKDGKYHFWQCSVSGLPTFAKPEYWISVMEKYKTEENLVKTFICKKAKKLMAAGMSQVDIIKTLNVVVSKEEKKERRANKAIKVKREKVIKVAKAKKIKKPRLASFAVGKVEVEVQNKSGSVEIQKVPVYPWQGDANYFGDGGTSVMSVEEATKESCAYPNRFLDGECNYCSAFSMCSIAEKLSKTKKSSKSVVKPLVSFDA